LRILPVGSLRQRVEEPDGARVLVPARADRGEGRLRPAPAGGVIDLLIAVRLADA
jgi:hypothetical protein